MGRKWTPEQRARQSEAIKAHWQRKKQREAIEPGQSAEKATLPYDWYRKYRQRLDEHKKDPYGVLRYWGWLRIKR